MSAVRTTRPAIPGPDSARVAEILSDPHDDPMENKAVRLAHDVLRQVPGAAFGGEPFMLTTLGRFSGQEAVVCSCFYHSVVFLGKHALVYTREEGNMVPWVSAPGFEMPDIDYFDSRVTLPDGVSAKLVSYVHEQMKALPQQPDVDPGRDADYDESEEEACAPAP